MQVDLNRAPYPASSTRVQVLSEATVGIEKDAVSISEGYPSYHTYLDSDRRVVSHIFQPPMGTSAVAKPITGIPELSLTADGKVDDSFISHGDQIRSLDDPRIQSFISSKQAPEGWEPMPVTRGMRDFGMYGIKSQDQELLVSPNSGPTLELATFRQLDGYQLVHTLDGDRRADGQLELSERINCDQPLETGAFNGPTEPFKPSYENSVCRMGENGSAQSFSGPNSMGPSPN